MRQESLGMESGLWFRMIPCFMADYHVAFDFNPEGIVYQSPRSAPQARHLGEVGKIVFTLKGFYSLILLCVIVMSPQSDSRRRLMPQSLARNYLHIVFSTKNRVPYLRDSDIRHEMFAYLGGVCRNQNSAPLIVGGMEDHVHILCHLSKSLSVETLVRELKRDSSKWLKSRGDDFRGFYWQAGYGAFSISPSHVESLEKYIAQQENHHRRTPFQEEFRRLLEKYRLEWDERYVWD